MTDEQDIDKPRFHLRFRHVVMLALLVLLVVWGLFRYKLKCQLEDAYAQIRADGYPVTPYELDKWYSIPDGVDNAADVIIEAFGYYAHWEGEREKQLLLYGSAKSPNPDEPIPDDMLKLIGEFLEDNSKALELLHKGAAIEYCRYPVDLSLGVDCIFTGVGEVWHGTKMLSLSVAYNAEMGRQDRAYESLNTILGLARSLSKEPAEVSHMYESSTNAMAVISLMRILNSGELTENQLKGLYDSFSEAISSEPFIRALAGDRCTGIDIFNMPASEGADYLMWTDSWIGMPILIACKGLGMADVDKLLYIQIINEYISAAKLPLPDAKKAFDAIDSEFKNLSNLHFMLKNTFWGWDRRVRMEIRFQGELVTALTAISIERYRLAEGHLPDKLSDLVPRYLDTVPIDPFDGNELRYKKLEPGYAVYAIGEDGVDNGGQCRISATSGDWPVTISR